MNYVIKNRDQHFLKDNQPKRILALDGGGLKGMISLAILQKIEDILKERHGNRDDFRLCHYFDLIAGTSTGAIIAATLAMGWTVEAIREKYKSLGKKVFEKSRLRGGKLRAKYDKSKLIKELKDVYGEKTKLGDETIQTGLLIITKRLDSGSPWPMSNNPKGKYFIAKSPGIINNSDYPLWQVVRASTAAPSFFAPEKIDIAKIPGYKTVQGEFVDGGVSPYNNPALQALIYATVDGYKVGWPLGEDNILLVSVGTGIADPKVESASLNIAGFDEINIAGLHAINALKSLMQDCSVQQETILQWMSQSKTKRKFDREIGDLGLNLIGGTPQLSYLRYDADLSRTGVTQLDHNIKDLELIDSLSTMDAPENMPLLHHIGQRAAFRDIKPDHFPNSFDLS